MLCAALGATIGSAIGPQFRIAAEISLNHSPHIGAAYSQNHSLLLSASGYRHCSLFLSKFAQMVALDRS
jgi:hypothetical protein